MFAFFVSSVLYMASRIYAFVAFLPMEEEVEQDKHFTYAYQIHLYTLFHGAAFVVLGFLLVRKASNTNLIFKKEYYKLILNWIIVIALLYFVPLIAVLGLSWYHGDDNETISQSAEGPGGQEKSTS